MYFPIAIVKYKKGIHLVLTFDVDVKTEHCRERDHQVKTFIYFPIAMGKT